MWVNINYMDCSKTNCNFKCWTFVMCALLSLITLIIGLLVVVGVIDSDPKYWTGVISMILGVWIPNPKLHFDKTEYDSEKRTLT